MSLQWAYSVNQWLRGAEVLKLLPRVLVAELLDALQRDARTYRGVGGGEAKGRADASGPEALPVDHRPRHGIATSRSEAAKSFTKGPQGARGGATALGDPEDVAA